MTDKYFCGVSSKHNLQLLICHFNSYLGQRKLYPGTGILGGVRRGDFKYRWDDRYCTAVNGAVDGDVDGSYVTGILPKHVATNNRTHVLIRESNYHPDGGQVFFPKNNDPFVAVLALPGDDIKLKDFVAFYCDGSFGINIHANVWHQPLYPINDEAVILGKQGAVHACVSLDTVDEFGKYLLIPLTKPGRITG